MKEKVSKFFKFESDVEKQASQPTSIIQNVLEPSNESCFPKLSYTDRLIGFAICFGLGIFIEFLSMGSIFGVLTGSPQKFAISYSLGNILSLLGTSFIIGFKKQLKNMADKERLYSSIIFVVSLMLTLFFALIVKIAIFVLLFILIQMGAYVWYIASYIPFARSLIKSVINKCFGKEII